MKAVTWHGRRDVRVDTVKDPKIEAPTDAIIEVTSTDICGSDLPLDEVLGAFMHEGEILGHEPMGIVGEVGGLSVGGRVVVPFQISCEIMPLLIDDDPLGVATFASHILPLDDAPHAYDIFQKKQDGAVKVMLKP